MREENEALRVELAEAKSREESTAGRLHEAEAAEIWEYLKEEYKGDERIKNMQVMNLIQEFEMKKMRESDAVKDYVAQLLSIADKVRLLGKEFSNEKIVQKILVTLPEKYEATISSLENSKDLSTISLTELLHSLEAVEQRRLMRN
eukprot:XP_010647193.1 PREDICTED: uncharacterized protein LOC104878447 [Vitis vinifera]